jgi:hypothetical protein
MSMDTTYFEEYQKQFTQWQKQCLNLQKQFFDTWAKTMPMGNNGWKMPENLEESLDAQKQLVNNYLQAQEETMTLALKAQKQFWDNYFELVKKTKLPQPAGVA